MRTSLLAAAALLGVSAALATPRFLPSGPLNIGYAADNECDDKVTLAVKNGLNVVIWSFIEIQPDAMGKPSIVMDRAPDLDCVAKTAQSLASAGLEVTHMVSLGGWAGPHPLPTSDPAGMYAVWKDWNEKTVARPGFTSGFAGE